MLSSIKGINVSPFHIIHQVLKHKLTVQLPKVCRVDATSVPDKSGVAENLYLFAAP
jgi:hypothetical protein